LIKKFVTTSIFLFLMWLALAGTHPQEIFFGAVISILISLFVSVYYFSDPLLKVRHFAPLKLLLFIPIFIYQEIIAHLKLVTIIYSPRLHINPGIVKVPLYLKRTLGITATAAAITMLPGTFTVHADKKRLVVHSITNPDDAVASSKKIERQLGEVFT